MPFLGSRAEREVSELTQPSQKETPPHRAHLPLAERVNPRAVGSGGLNAGTCAHEESPSPPL